MKVYGGCLMTKDGQVRGIVAGTQKQVSAATGLSLSYVRKYWTETGNNKEVRIANSEPGVLFYTSTRWSDAEYLRFSTAEPAAQPARMENE
jgi:hypothetical protein